MTRFKKVFFISMLCTLALPLQSFAAYEFYVTIEGAKQGRFKGETGPRHDKIGGLRFNYEVVSPRDAASGLPTGKRQHKPIFITKAWGAASPQIFTALVTNENLKTVVLEFVRPRPDGAQEIYHTIKLTNASISNLHQFTEAANNSGQELEDIGFTFQKIEILTKDGGNASDDWGQSAIQ